MTKQAEQVKHTATPLDLVCILQKHHDSNRVLECREDFNNAEKQIIKAVNNHDALVEALEALTDAMENCGIESDDPSVNMAWEQAKQALEQARG